MILIKLALGIILFSIGWIYLYKSNIVLNINRLAREIIFNDRLILLYRNRLAILFFCLSFITLFMAFTTFTNTIINEQENSWIIDSNKYLMYKAMQDYCSKKYNKAIEKYLILLKSEPNNIKIMKHLAYAYNAMGEKNKAKIFLKRINSETSKSNK